MLRWNDLETRTPEEVLAVGRQKRRMAVSEAVNLALKEKREQYRHRLDEEYKSWLNDAETCLNNGIRFFLIRQALLNSQVDVAKKHMKFVAPRDDSERTEYEHILQDYNDKVIEANTRRMERHRSNKGKKLLLSNAQETMLREVAECSKSGTKYTSMVNHGDVRKTATFLEKKGLVEIRYTVGKTVENKRKQAQPFIENVICTMAGYEYLKENV